jgi:hypothetical protein
MGDDGSASKFESCVTEIVSADGGEVEEVKYELNGKWARVRFHWDDAGVKQAVIYDLRADEVVDLISGEERDELRLRDG